MQSLMLCQELIILILAGWKSFATYCKLHILFQLRNSSCMVINMVYKHNEVMFSKISKMKTILFIYWASIALEYTVRGLNILCHSQIHFVLEPKNVYSKL